MYYSGVICVFGPKGDPKLVRSNGKKIDGAVCETKKKLMKAIWLSIWEVTGFGIIGEPSLC
jgi:hypothetical protein